MKKTPASRKPNLKKPLKNIANFLFEAGILAKTPRSGFHFLGGGKQSVAEHVNRTTIIGYTLASMEKSVDIFKVMKMCMFHDFAEARTSDLNYVHQLYVAVAETRAIHDFAAPLPFGRDIEDTLREYEERKSRESIIAKDADHIELILTLKEIYDTGNERPTKWMETAVKRIKTETARKLALEITNTPSDEWWHSDKDNDWWVNRNGKQHLS